LLTASGLPDVTPGAQECREWRECQQLALDAAGRQDYNAFHDLAWRTLQLGPKNDPALMTMLARAQSLSGRPGDALVMLQRLAAMGVVTDAATNNDFERVRALPGWADLEAKLAGTPPSPAAVASAPPKPATLKPDPGSAVKPAAASAAKSAAAGGEKTAAKADAATTEAKPDAAKPDAPKPAKADSPEPKGKPAPKAGSPLLFTAPSLAAVGLAYDAVSGRFIVADGKEQRLLVVGERSGRLANLAGMDAGFDEVSAFEIDTVEGDLWVVSSSNQSKAATVHKLQLISGRVLASIPLPAAERPARFTDIAVTPQNILVLDGGGRRVYRVAKKGRTLELIARLASPSCSSLAPGPEGIAYTSYDQGILRLDLATRAMTVVEPPEQEPLNDLRWIRWHRGSLVAIQGGEGGKLRLLRLRLDDAGRRVRSVDVLDGSVALAGPTSATLSGNSVYYLGSNGSDELEVKKLVLK
jgi:hypothetical protein